MRGPRAPPHPNLDERAPAPGVAQTIQEDIMTYPTTRPATWFVTGASRGLGLDLVSQLLRRGDNVTATTRSVERLAEALVGVDTSRLLPLPVDLADEAEVADAVAETKARFGGLDVVVNNAGYGFLAAVEEVSDTEARQMFDVQIFGVWNVLRAVLPGFRENRSGHVINVSSILGLTSFPGWGLYCAGKYALEGLTESLAAEVADHGIDVTLIEPGYMRTDFLRPQSLGLPGAALDAYPAIREMTDAHQAMPGTQLGDPAQAAAAIITVATTGTAPLHQLLGSDSLSFAEARAQSLTREIEAARALAVTTDIVA
jgi:NAD(P)-dependent dehydrogenase (short-subunit alcohol dehydrogenase family)